jgi:Amt family ammonium transporter
MGAMAADMYNFAAGALPAFAADASAVGASAEALEAFSQKLDFVWVLLAGALVFVMQVGFLLLEAGMVRSKNSINVAQKNFLDFMFAVVVFAAFGFMFAFGSSVAGFPIGFDLDFLMLENMTPWLWVFFVFQVMFCGTAATIVSGAVAERMKLWAYVICTLVMSGLIYPVFAHWAWGAALGPNEGAFLANMGYVDFAGSTVVHATGGWLALAACLVLGARIGRFDENGRPRRMTGHNPVLAAAGALLLFFGWIGFNGGSTLAVNADIAHIIANTVLAGAAGGVAGYFLGWFTDGLVLPDKALNGSIGGLVAVTAGCAVLDAKGALLIGALGGVAALYANTFIEEKLKIDDSVGAIGVHGVGGVFGTIGLALLAPAANLPIDNRWEQLGVQAFGVAVNFAWAFGIGLIFFKLLDLIRSVRVSREDEELGLNEAEHGTKLGIGHVEEAFGALAKGDADLTMRLEVEPGDEAERLTHVFNALMDNLQREESARGDAAEVARTAEEAERLSTLAETTFEALCICAEGRIVDANAAFVQLAGTPLDELKGRELRTFVVPADHARFEAATAKPIEITFVTGTDEAVPVEIRARELTYRGAPTRVLALIDLRDRKQAEAQIRYLAQHDPLTSLPNRALFNQRLDEMVERAGRDEIMSAVLLVDLDRFKDINDLHGHQAGDEVIRTSAERLRAAVRQGDMVARLGGDEFGVLQPALPFANQAADLAHRLVHELSKPIRLADGAVVRSGASIGVALCPRDAVDGATLITRADTALYHVKERGRNSFAVFEEGMDKEIRRRQLLEADLAHALEREEFELFFQPRLSVGDGRIASYEALIRWRHPEKGLVGPSEFISVAEHSGRIVAIGEWVLRTACKLAVEQLGDARISVNASPLQFRERQFVEKVEAALRDAGLPPQRLEIEITESVLIDDDKRAIALLKDLKRVGVEIALDDFGTGYSSLGYLSRFPFDTIKIDRSFVSGVDGNDDSRAIVDTIIRLGHALNMDIVAEGVERVEELRVLADCGCEQVQGYLIGKPEPLAQLVRSAPENVLQALGCAQPVPIINETHEMAPQERAVLALQRRVEALLHAMPVPEETPIAARARRSS